MISPLKKVQQSKISLNKYLLQERFLISTKRYPSLSQLCKQYVKASVRLNSSVYYINTYQQVETNERPHFQQLSSPDQQAHERLSGSTLSKTLMKSQSLGSLSDKVLHEINGHRIPKVTLILHYHVCSFKQLPNSYTSFMQLPWGIYTLPKPPPMFNTFISLMKSCL